METQKLDKIFLEDLLASVRPTSFSDNRILSTEHTDTEVAIRIQSRNLGKVVTLKLNINELV